MPFNKLSSPLNKFTHKDAVTPIALKILFASSRAWDLTHDDAMTMVSSTLSVQGGVPTHCSCSSSKQEAQAAPNLE